MHGLYDCWKHVAQIVSRKMTSALTKRLTRWPTGQKVNACVCRVVEGSHIVINDRPSGVERKGRTGAAVMLHNSNMLKASALYAES